VWFEFPRDEDDAPDAHYFDFWIYSYHHQLPVINALKSAPKSFFSEWAMGKLLGYSDASMEEYLSHHVMSGLNVNTELLKEED